mmetsp:Transcript_11413/g.21906  ORF Transcript_11413/g.21906 Transcript_11413/m.21906 type:complete len:96 (-) Transcript_11413:876-1163(-)
MLSEPIVEVYVHHEIVNGVCTSNRKFVVKNMVLKRAIEAKKMEVSSNPLAMASQDVPAAAGAAINRNSVGCAVLGNRQMSTRCPSASRGASFEID